MRGERNDVVCFLTPAAFSEPECDGPEISEQRHSLRSLDSSLESKINLEGASRAHREG